MLLPGTAIVYYGDEIGMTDYSEITCEQTRDRYALPPYADECVGFPDETRDAARTPMQWAPGDFGGFVNKSAVQDIDSYEPWLPVNPNHVRDLSHPDFPFMARIFRRFLSMWRLSRQPAWMLLHRETCLMP